MNSRNSCLRKIRKNRGYGRQDKGKESNILDNSIFRINKTCIDCKEDYEATYSETGRLNCHMCGLTSHGCKPNEKVQAAELYKMSKGYKWICYDCTKDMDRIREENMRWDRDEETEENRIKKINGHAVCSKCTGSSVPIVEPIIIDITPSTPKSTPLSPIDFISGTTGDTANGEEKDKDNGKEETQVSWKQCIENLV